ncbi:mll2104 [Mesorhizobium japonicum MAFF 303099]|uniref:Mll2104 protein n=1 Tax=Mesorhizobium japonicum (strain LMG 29417 / CECT 9101 / MAFF 303099) TaxID=266835 RepID=Q98J49_RHILO|nr:mll2104 [Mesorhizobium japonicum MAFF 303099]
MSWNRAGSEGMEIKRLPGRPKSLIVQCGNDITFVVVRVGNRRPPCGPRRASSPLRRLRLAGVLFAIQKTEIPGTRAAVGMQEALGGQATAQQLTHGGRAARHALVETPCVEGREFFLVQHHLQPFRTLEIVSHRGGPFLPAMQPVSRMSK